MSNLVDSYGRRATMLRLSITDRCNLACTYCVPPNLALKKPCDLMSDEEILRLSRVMVGQGIGKIRLTGGEPLVRRGVVALAARLRESLMGPDGGLRTLAVSTNGLLLEQMAAPLWQAGVTAANVSLDTFDPARYKQISGGGNVLKVLAGIATARRVGMKVRVNTVALKSSRDEDLKRLVALAAQEDIEVRFLEYMPLCGDAWNPDDFLPYADLLQRLERFTTLGAEPYHPRDKTRYYALPGGRGKVGVIASITSPFCSDCTRIRLSSSGRIRACLFSKEEVDLLTPLRQGASDEDLAAIARRVVWNKPVGHGVNPAALHTVEPLAQGLIRTIGG